MVKGFVCLLSLFSLTATLWTVASHSVHGDSQGKNTGGGCRALLQGIFPIQGSNPCLIFPALAGRFFTTSTPWEACLKALFAAVYYFTISATKSVFINELFCVNRCFTRFHSAQLDLAYILTLGDIALGLVMGQNGNIHPLFSKLPQGTK